jgi:hypothetical protein
MHPASEKNGELMIVVFGTVGAIAVAYCGVRVVATILDIIGRWRRNDW